MALPLQSFASLVKTQAAAMSASCSSLVDTTVGSVARALLEANASVGLWVQWLIAQALAATRAATSNGPDLDSWVNDYGMARLPAVASTGLVVFMRATPGLESVIMPGALVRTGTGASDQVYTVIADPLASAWNGVGYVLSAADSSVVAPVSAQVAGSAGNVVAGAVAMLGSPIIGVDAVTNPAAMAGGMDAETDEALRRRFSGFLDSRTRATSQAVSYAIESVQQGLSYTILDQVDASGATRPGHFTVTVDDGSGAPGESLLSAVANAVDQVRAIGATFTVRPPLLIPVTVQMQVTGPNSSIEKVRSAISTYILSLPLGAPLTVTRLYQVGYEADSNVTNLTDALVNGMSADLTPPVFGLLRPSSVQITS